jgi:endonuclease-3
MRKRSQTAVPPPRPLIRRHPAKTSGSVDPALRLRAITAWLDQRFPDWMPELSYGSPWELLAATILSAQCTDARVNQVTPVLFRRYPTVDAMAAASPHEVEAIIRSTGFFRTKSRHLIGCARQLLAEHGGTVPDGMEPLTQLPGIGRKTANVVLGNAFGRPAVVVDTHVRRVSQRLGLTRSADPVRIEAELARLFPQTEWTRRSHQLLLHGRYVCLARRPRCAECGLRDYCPWYRTHVRLT